MKGCYWAISVALAGGIAAFGVHWGQDRADAPRGGTVAAEFGLSPEEAAPPAGLRPLAARLVAKERAVRALLSGDATLLEVAARFRALDAQEPRARPELHPEVYAGATEAERYCRAVLFWVHTVAWTYSHEGHAAGAAARQLEDELEGHRACGTLELPPAPEYAESAPRPPSPGQPASGSPSPRHPPSPLSQRQVRHPAPAGVFPSAAAAPQDRGVRAAGVLQNVGQHRQAVEGPLVEDGVGEFGDGAAVPGDDGRGERWGGAEGVGEEVAEEVREQSMFLLPRPAAGVGVEICNASGPRPNIGRKSRGHPREVSDKLTKVCSNSRLSATT
jgi:hypothetical protein